MSIIHFCLSRDDWRRAENLFSLRLYDIHLSALHDGAPSVQLEEENLLSFFCSWMCFAPIASQQTHIHTTTEIYIISFPFALSYLSFSLYFSRDILSFFYLSLFFNPLISFFRTHSIATVCNQRVSSIHGATVGRISCLSFQKWHIDVQSRTLYHHHHLSLLISP